MQFIGRALIASAFVLTACAGGDKAADTTAAATPDTAATAAATTPAAATPAVTGETHDVQMVLDNGAYKYVPADITVKPGDAIKFINVSGGPHNVHFKAEETPDDMEPVLARNMPAEAGGAQKLGPTNSPLLTQPNETYTITFDGVKAGKYPFVCTPHEALGMKGTVTVTQ